MLSLIRNKWRNMRLQQYVPLPSQRYNIQVFKNSPLSEIAGSFGDLGTLLPLMLTLSVHGSIDLTTTLVFTGIANILTGLYFRIPLPVQPMKAIAAVAIANNYSVEETISAGVFVACIIFFFSVTGVLEWVGLVIPTPIVKGIQVGAGLSLVLSAGEKLLLPLGWTRPNWADNWLWAFGAFVFLLIATGPNVRGTRLPKIPYALVVFLTGLVFTLILIHTPRRNQKKVRLPNFFSFWSLQTYLPSWQEFRTGAFDAGLGQLPLTTLNSIVAVTYLAAELLPTLGAQTLRGLSDDDVPNPPSFTMLGVSIVLMNLIPTWFGSMPVCHGSGGLAGQWKFGARSGASVIFLGTIKLIIGLAVNGKWLTTFLRKFPKSLLGIMVIAAGVELARVGEGLNTVGAVDLVEIDEGSGMAGAAATANGSAVTKRIREVDDQERMERWTIMMITVAGILAFKNDAVGFMAGLLCHVSIRFTKNWRFWNWRSTLKSRSQKKGGNLGEDDAGEGDGLLRDTEIADSPR